MQQRPSGLQNQKHLLSGALQESGKLTPGVGEGA